MMEATLNDPQWSRMFMVGVRGRGVPAGVSAAGPATRGSGLSAWWLASFFPNAQGPAPATPPFCYTIL